MLSTSWSICGIDTDGHDLTLSRLVAWGEAGELVPTSVTCTVPPVAGALANLLVDDATTVTFTAADVRQPGFSITFEFAEPVELWGWRMAAPTQTGWPCMYAVKSNEHLQFFWEPRWLGSGLLSEAHTTYVNFDQQFGSWITLNGGGNSDWRCITTHDGNTVYAGVNGGYIHKSTDGGATWVALTAAGNRSWRGLATHDGVVVYAASYGGAIYKSTDGGATWVVLTAAGSRSWERIATHDGVTVYAAVYGSSGAIYKTIDGGTTWVALTAAGSRNWEAVATHDGVTVYAAVYGASSGEIYKSTDGGATWGVLPSAGARGWEGLATHDGVVVYATTQGASGAIYKSTNGGESWVLLSDAGRRNWYDIATHDGGTVYATSNGFLYKSEQMPQTHELRYRSVATATPIAHGAPPLETATLAVEPVFSTQDLDVGGHGRIYGTVKRKADSQDIPLVRRVRLHDSRTGALLRQTWSQEDGSYEFQDLNPGLEYDVIAWDHEGQFRSTIANNLKPEVLP